MIRYTIVLGVKCKQTGTFGHHLGRVKATWTGPPGGGVGGGGSGGGVSVGGGGLCQVHTYCKRTYFRAAKFSRIKPSVTFSRRHIFTHLVTNSI